MAFRSMGFRPGHAATPGALLRRQRWFGPKRSQRDRYNDRGTPVLRTLPTGERVLAQTGDNILLEGNGASEKGDYPFLSRFNLKTLKSERIFQAGEGTYENVVALVKEDGSQ